MNDFYSYYYNKALHMAQNRDITSALCILKECGLPDGNTEIQRLAGLCYYRLGNFAMAKELMPDEDVYNDSYDDGLSTAAEYIRQQKYGEALNTLLKNSLGSVNDYNMIGCAYMLVKNSKSARQYWRLALEMDMNNRFSLNCLAEDIQLGGAAAFLWRLKGLFKR